MRALRERPTTLERWPGGVVEGARISTREGFKGEAFYQKRVPQGAPTTSRPRTSPSPSGRTADEIAPDRAGGRRVGGAARHGDLPPVAGAPGRRRPPRRAAARPRSRARHGLPRRRRGGARAARAPRRARDHGWPKTSGGRGVHVYVRIEPRWGFIDVRHAAIAIGRELERRLPGRVTTKWWKEERAARHGLRRLQPERARPHDRLGVLHPAEGARARCRCRCCGRSSTTSRRSTSPCARAGPRFAEVGDRMSGIDDTAYDLTTLLSGTSATRRTSATCPIRRTTRRCRASRCGSSRAARRPDLH